MYVYVLLRVSLDPDVFFSSASRSSGLRRPQAGSRVSSAVTSPRVTVNASRIVTSTPIVQPRPRETHAPDVSGVGVALGSDSTRTGGENPDYHKKHLSSKLDVNYRYGPPNNDNCWCRSAEAATDLVLRRSLRCFGRSLVFAQQFASSNSQFRLEQVAQSHYIHACLYF